MKHNLISNILKKSCLVLTFVLSFAPSTQANVADSSVIDTTKIKTPKIEISGSVDAYFRHNITGSNGEKAIAPKTSFANLNGFALGMANVIFKMEHQKVGFVADLAFGPRAEDADFNSPILRPGGISQIVNQLYVFYNVTDHLKFTLGNFNTFLGYEYISPVGNFNYSTSYLFSYGPFSHTGIKADLALTDDLTAMFAILNKTDATEFNPNGDYTIGAQIGFKGTYLNALYGRQGTTPINTLQVDLTSGFQLSDKFFLGLNASVNSTAGAGFYGVAIYPQLALSDAFSIGSRGEYFAETQLGVGAIGAYDTKGNASMYEATLTGSYKKGNLTIKPEFRVDSSPTAPVFLDAKSNSVNSLSSFLLGVIYSF